MNRHVAVVLAFACLAATSSCSAISDPGDGLVCTADFRYGLSVHVLDSLTNASAATGAKLVARAGTYADSTTGPFPGSSDVLVGAGEHAGTYTLTISKT